MELDRELVFGAAARRLEPRAIPVTLVSSDPRAPPWDGGRARVAFRTSALDRDQHLRLRASGGVRLAALDEHETLLESPAEILAELALSFEPARILLRAHVLATLPPVAPTLLGILNATPDSFSDGGRHLDPERAAQAAEAMVAAGAHALDVGGESTRPGSQPVALETELARVLPVVEAVRARGVAVPISIDTRRAVVAARALDAGANAINDTSAGLDDPEMLPLAAERACPYVVMHRLGRSADMQRDPRYEDPVREVAAWLRERGFACLQAGIGIHNIALDPGIGFGKRVQDNVALIRRLVELRSLGRPLLVGVSRKSYLGRLSGVETPSERGSETAAAVALAVIGGAAVLRVHDVAETARAAAVACAHAGLLENSVFHRDRAP